MYALVLQISAKNENPVHLYEADGHKKQFVFKSNGIKIEFMTSNKNNDQGFDLSWRG